MFLGISRPVGSTNSAGGYTVPTKLATFIVESMKAFGPMYTSPVFTSIETAAGNPVQHSNT